MVKLAELWRKEPVMIVGGVLEVTLAVLDGIDGHLGAASITRAAVVAILAWAARANVYSPHTVATYLGKGDA